jgi:Fe-S-cluster-containing hydrogenase component 2
MKRLFINLEACDKCPECVIKCSYIYHPDNIGITPLRELATFATICHRCEDAPCVAACYKDALERQENGLIKRYNLRCVSCKSCTVACPFGIIFPDLVPYLSGHCDYCLGRNNKKPDCIASCPENALEFKELEEDPENNIWLVSDYLAVKAPKWSKEEIS